MWQKIRDFDSDKRFATFDYCIVEFNDELILLIGTIMILIIEEILLKLTQRQTNIL